MVPHIGTVEEELGPILGPKVMRILDKNPPRQGEFVEIAPDNSQMRWVDASGKLQYLNLRSRAVWFGEDEEEDEATTDGEQVA